MSPHTTPHVEWRIESQADHRRRVLRRRSLLGGVAAGVTAAILLVPSPVFDMPDSATGGDAVAVQVVER